MEAIDSSPESAIITALKSIDKVLSSHRDLDLNNIEIIQSITSIRKKSLTLGHLFTEIPTTPTRKRRLKDPSYRPAKRLEQQHGYLLRQRHSVAEDPNYRNQGAVDTTRGVSQERAKSSEHDRQTTSSQDTATDAMMPPCEPSQVSSTNFTVFRNDEGSRIGFQFEDVLILEDAIKTIKESGWLEDVHIALYCAYLKANLAARNDHWKIHFFGPLTVKDIQEGWNHILAKEGQHRKQSIDSSQYLAFPVVTDQNDHWFMIILASPSLDGFATGAPMVYFMDPLWYDWETGNTDLFLPMRRIVSALEKGSGDSVRFFQATEGVVPQQSKELCGYYIMLYFELLARGPETLLQSIQESASRFTPGDLDQMVQERYLGLVEDFQHAEEREDGSLVTKSGDPMITGRLRCFAFDLNKES